MALPYGYALPLLFLQTCCLKSVQDTSGVGETPVSLLRALIGPNVVNRTVYSPTSLGDEEDEQEGSSAAAADLPDNAIKALIASSAAENTTNKQGVSLSSNVDEQFSDRQSSSSDVLYGKQGVTINPFQPNRSHQAVLTLATPKALPNDSIFFHTPPSFSQQARNVIHSTLGLPISTLTISSDGRKQPLIATEKVTNEYSKLLKKVSRPGKNKRYGIGSGATSFPWWTKHDEARSLFVVQKEEEYADKRAERLKGKAGGDSIAAGFLRSPDGVAGNMEQGEVRAVTDSGDESRLGVEEPAKGTKNTRSPSQFEATPQIEKEEQCQPREFSSAKRALAERMLSHAPTRAGKKGLNARKHKSFTLYNTGRKARRGQEKSDYYELPQEFQRSSRRRNEQMRQYVHGVNDIMALGFNDKLHKIDEPQPFSQASHAVGGPSIPDVWIDEEFDEEYDRDVRERGSHQQPLRRPSSEKRRTPTKSRSRRLGGAYDYYLPQAYDLPMLRPANSPSTQVAQSLPPTYTPLFPPKEHEHKEPPQPASFPSHPSLDSNVTTKEDIPEPTQAALPSETVRKPILFSRRKQENAAGVTEPFFAAEVPSNTASLQGENKNRLPMLTRKRNNAENDGKKEHAKNSGSVEHHKPENRRPTTNRSEDKPKRDRSEKGKFRQKKSKTAGETEE